MGNNYIDNKCVFKKRDFAEKLFYSDFCKLKMPLFCIKLVYLRSKRLTI